MKKLAIVSLALVAFAFSASAQIHVLGHRGVRFNTKEEPATPYYENTLPALKYCQSLDGIYAAEFDIQLTSDGKIIVYHGPSIPGLEKNIHEITFREARRVVLPGDHQMPTLPQYLRQAKKHPEVRLVLEIKPQDTPERETRAVELAVKTVRRMHMESQLDYTTFSPWMVAEIHRVDPSARVLFLDSGKNVHDPEYAKSIGADEVSYDRWSLKHNPDWVARAHALGLKVTLWLANDNEVTDWALAHDVDFITSDHPEKVLEYLKTLK